MGYGQATGASIAASPGTGLVAVQNPSCSLGGGLTRWSQCAQAGGTCDHDKDVYIVCGHEGQYRSTFKIKRRLML